MSSAISLRRGRLPATLADRSIVIPMQRRGHGEHVARFRSKRADQEAAPIRTDVKHALKSCGGAIEATYASLPQLSFLSDRDEELFGPLFAVCAVLAPAKVGELNQCAHERWPKSTFCIRHAGPHVTHRKSCAEPHK